MNREHWVVDDRDLGDQEMEGPCFICHLQTNEWCNLGINHFILLYFSDFLFYKGVYRLFNLNQHERLMESETGKPLLLRSAKLCLVDPPRYQSSDLLKLGDHLLMD